MNVLQINRPVCLIVSITYSLHNSLSLEIVLSEASYAAKLHK